LLFLEPHVSDLRANFKVRPMLAVRPIGIPIAAVFAALPGPAVAIDVSHPEVTKGATELRNVNLVTWDRHDDGSPRHTHEFHLGYSVTDTLALKGILTLEGASGEETKATIGAIEGTYELVDIEKHGVGLAWYTLADVAIEDDASSDVLFGPIMKVNFGKVSAVANTYVVRSFGDNRTPGTDFTYAWLLSYHVANGLKLGVEGDGGLDHVFHLTPAQEQEHRIGPAVFAEFDVGGRTVTLDVGLQFGLTSPCTDHEAKIILGTVF
jgi:hypothetical protein